LRNPMKTIVLFITVYLSFSAAAPCQQGVRNQASSQSPTDQQAEIRDLLSKLQTNPKSSFLHNQLAVLYSASGNLAGFEKEINIAIELEPMDPINYFQAAVVYGRNRDEKKQILMLEKAIKLDPHNPVFRFERARAYEVKGLHHRAKQEYLEARQLLAHGVQTGKESQADHVLRNARIVEGTYYDSFNNAYSVENLAAGIEKALLRVAD
jgi:tetratricopeptide (TPR) repeat protein